MKSAYLSPPRDLSPKKLSCFSSQGRVDFLQLMIESQNSTSHKSNEANHSYKCNNIQIRVTGTGAAGVRRIWGAVSQRKAQWVTTTSTDQLQAEASVPCCQHQGGLRGIPRGLCQGVGLPYQSFIPGKISGSSLKSLFPDR